jgi:hypothetical protein
VTAQTMPAFLGGLCELEDHGERGLVGKTPSRSDRRWRTVANVLSIGFDQSLRIWAEKAPKSGAAGSSSDHWFGKNVIAGTQLGHSNVGCVGELHAVVHHIRKYYWRDVRPFLVDCVARFAIPPRTRKARSAHDAKNFRHAKQHLSICHDHRNID